MQRLRQMRVAPFQIPVLRNGAWTQLSTDELLVGDLCLVRAHAKKDKKEAKNVLPCDMLLLHGSAVVNEAILTGESVPQVKESVEERDGDELLDVKGKHLTHVLNGGTELI